jgi:DNA-binding MarR family transcriptional regulator
LSLPGRVRGQADGDRRTISLSEREARDAARLLTRLIGESPELVEVILKSPARTARGHHETADRRSLLDLAKRALFERRQRSEHLTKAIFGEPAWDVLLVLYIADFVGGKQTIGNVASLVDVPVSTVVRWVRQLEREQLATREPHPHDRRMVFVRLGKRGREVLDRYFSSLPE